MGPQASSLGNPASSLGQKKLRTCMLGNPGFVQAKRLECFFVDSIVASYSKMACSQCRVSFPMLSQDNITSTEAVMSITTVNTPKKSFFRAVVSVKGESERCFGTRHTSALHSAKKLLSNLTERISAAAKNRVMRDLRRGFRPRKHGVQPRCSWCGSQKKAKLCRGLRGKRKSDHVNGIQNSLLTRKRWKSGLPAKTNDPEEGKVGKLHYFLRMPAAHQEVAPLLLFLHGSGERGKEDGSELHKVRKHGPWKCVGAAPCFILAPQCPRGRVWPALVEDVLLMLTDVCERHVVDKSRIYITGLSMGAFGAWSLAVSQPKKFAAIVSICGGFIGGRVPMETSRAQMLKLAETDCEAYWERRKLKKCARVPVWLFHCMKDRIIDPKCSEFVFHALGGTGNENVRRTFYGDAGHHCWGKAYNTLDLYTWLLTHSQRLVH